ncbi:MAG: putative lipid II flippase FtsW [Candidatus Buchananbacteria bacterium]|nr:putative lipid II flippase FtsW [Candidatus Buchananbacteria bacterium]
MRRFHLANKKKKSNLLSRVLPDQKRFGKTPDYFLAGLFFVIILFGLLMLSSASSVSSFREYNDVYFFLKRQIIRGFLPGLALFVFFTVVNYRTWEKFTVPIFGLALLLLVMVLIPGIGATYNQSQSWISIGGLSFQPSEVVKLLLILSLAGWFSYRGEAMTGDFWNGFLPFLVILGLVGGLVALSDLGTAIVIVAIAVVIYFVAGARIRHVISLVVLGFGAAAVLIAKAPYRAERLMTFLNPELDPLGFGYHINQAFLAIGSGGLFGLGFGQSRQKFAYLPEVMGDSIFAIIAEELGFIFAASLIVLFLLLAWRGLKLAKKVEDDYARYIVVGIIGWFTWQAFFNIAAMIGLMPLTGIPLPFISYGGTALASAMAAAGILINISRQS